MDIILFMILIILENDITKISINLSNKYNSIYLINDTIFFNVTNPPY